MARNDQMTEAATRGDNVHSPGRLTSVKRRLSRLTRWLPYLMAVVAIVLATALRLWLGQIFGPTLPSYTFFYPMVMAVALYGGTRPGLFASALSALAVTWVFLHPAGTLAIAHPADQVSFAIFCGVNVSISLVCGAFRAARHRALTEARRAYESEERFRLFMDNTPTLVWVKDDQGRYTYLNRAYEQRFRLTLAQCQGKTDAEIWPPEVADRLQQADRAALAAGRPIEVTEETTEPNGAVSFWLNTKFPIRDTAGRRFIASIGLDITDRKRFQEAVQESETRLRLAFDTAELGMYERDLVANVITMNPACQAILGATEPYPSDIAARSVHPEDRGGVLAQVAAAFDPAVRQVCSAEFRVLRPDGSLRWVAGRGRVLFDDHVQPPRPAKFIGVLNDITERKLAEESLRRSQARSAMAIRVAGLGAFEHDHVAGLVEFSPRLREMYGFAPDEVVTVPAILARTAPEVREKLAEDVRRAWDPASDGLFETEHQIFVPGREPRWVSVRSQTFFEGTGGARVPVRTIGAVSDITTQKEHTESLGRMVQERTAKLEETVAELEHFSYTITHDMRAPLRALSGYSTLLINAYADALPEQGRDLLRRISQSAIRMDQLITDALQYSRVVRQELQLEPLDPGMAIRGIIESYPQFQQPHASIDVQPDMPPVLANAAALTQVFSNLLGNAVKFVTQAQLPRITVSAERRGDRVRFWVEDNGVGIPPEHRDRIWLMFQRLSKDYEGTGIGLALVRKVVERMGGKVGVASAPGGGSRFWFELRGAPAPNGSAAHTGPP